MAQINVAWPICMQPSAMWQPRDHGVHRFVRKTSWCAVGLSSNLGLGKFPRLTLTPVLAVPGLEAQCGCHATAIPVPINAVGPGRNTLQVSLLG